MAITRQTLWDALLTRLAGITTGNGYQTNAGNHVHEWRGNFFETTEDLPALNVKDEKRETQQKLVGVHEHRLHVAIEVAATGSTTAAAADEVRKIFADLNKAIAVDRRWAGVAIDTDPKEDEMAVEHRNRIIAGGKFSFSIRYRNSSFDEQTQP